MRKRTKPRVVWLPSDTGIDANIPGAGGPSTFYQALISLSTNTPQANLNFPLTVDKPQAPGTNSLADVENSGYRLRRIVGKIWCLGDRLDDESGIIAFSITAGFIIRRVDEEGTPLTEIADVVAGTVENSSPNAADNESDPWIWRRSWLLANPNFFPLTAITEDRLPPLDNVPGLSVLDGPHVDQKTARIIGSEERLFLSVGAQVILSAGASDLTNETQLVWDLRVLASMKSNVGNRRNASR